MLSISEFLKTYESSAFTRARWNAALGLGPSIPDAAIHSRSTAPNAIVKLIKKRNKKKKKKNSIKKNMSETHDIDRWLSNVELLKQDLEILDKLLKNSPVKKDVDSRSNKKNNKVKEIESPSTKSERNNNGSKFKTRNNSKD